MVAPTSGDVPPVSRGACSKAGTAGIAGLNLPTLLRAAEASVVGSRPKAKHVIFLHQFGGPSHLDTFDMKPDAPDGIRGEFKPIAVQPAGPERHRAPAAVRQGARPVRPGAVGPPQDEEPQLGDLLQPDRPRPAARRHPAPRYPGTLPGLWEHGRQVPAGRRSGRPVVRLLSRTSPRRQRHARPDASFLGKAYDPFFIGQDPNRPTSGSPS